MNEVALDYNAGFQLCLAALLDFGYGVKDEGLDFDRAWPQKAPTPDITITVSDNTLSIATGSGLMCSAWCVSFKSDAKIEGAFECTPYEIEPPNYTICNKRDNGFLDGEGTPQTAKLQVNYASEFTAPDEYEVLCDGSHSGLGATDMMYKPEFGHKFKVTGKGGPSNTKPLYEESKCWPSHIC